MDKKQRISTITTFCLVLFFAFMTVAYALIKGPSDIYASLEGEKQCDLHTGDGCVLTDQAKDDVTGFYQPENISNFVDVPGVSGKLFGVRKGGFALSSFIPSGPTTLALLTTPVVTGGGGGKDDDNNNNNNNNNFQQLTVVQCDEGYVDCNGECILEEDTCEEPQQTDRVECDPQQELCEENIPEEIPTHHAPEPATMILFGTGLAGAALRKRFSA